MPTRGSIPKRPFLVRKWTYFGFLRLVPEFCVNCIKTAPINRKILKEMADFGPKIWLFRDRTSCRHFQGASLQAQLLAGTGFPPAVLILPLSSTRYNRFLSSRGLVRLFMRCYCNLSIHPVCRGMRYSCMFALSCTAVNLYGVSTQPTSQA